MIDLHGKTAVVTGAGRGIGAAIAETMAAAGAAVCIVDLDGEACEKHAAHIGEQGYTATTAVGDVRDRNFAEDVIGGVVEDYGSVDVLVNNAGIIRDNLIERLEDRDWDDVLDVNLKGAFLFCRAAVPHMKDRGAGSIVNIASRAWLGQVGQANYTASKGGLVSLTRTLALELARHGVRVNAVAPGLINTPLVRDLPEEVRQRLIRAQPGGRMGTPQEVADAVCFLASDRASFITGQVLHVDGGKSCGLLSL